MTNLKPIYWIDQPSTQQAIKDGYLNGPTMVRQLNTHDGLLEALKRYVEGDDCGCVDEQIWQPGGGSYTTKKSVGPCAYCQAIAAIAKAEGRS